MKAIVYTGLQKFMNSDGLKRLAYHERIKNESDHHIPIGLYHDLADNIDDIVDGCDRPRLNAYFRISVKKIVFEWNFGLIRKKNNSS
ncbi:MAG TPA: hypothetical protein PKA44_13395 [Saprospiraceae bacterium]|nr:hypothetical protein [Saprospiraceae bacterium]